MRGWGSRIRAGFPEREFIIRSDGRVRFVRVSSRVQVIAVVSALLAVAMCAAAMAVAGWTQYRAASERAALLTREAKIATAEDRLAAYGDDLEAVTADLDQRQDFIENMVASLPDDVKTTGAPRESAGETTPTVERISVAFPQAAPLARLEARQLAFVESLTRYAEWHAQKAAAALETLGLDPDAMMRQADRTAMGGPLERLATSANGTVDPRFERLGLSIARMTALENGLSRVPQVEPANLKYVSSGFGYRRDPFTGGGAMHSGLDFRGPLGAPIHAAAKGKVGFVGPKAGYGLTVEIDHGNGLMTRYAHMSRFDVARGQNVEPGEVIGGIGSTGRSTGPHLHFEVRIHNKAVNPRTFLETAPDVLEEIRRAPRLAADR